MTPTPDRKLAQLIQLIDRSVPFTFIRFSDGEIEILRNRELYIGNGLTKFRGRVTNNCFPDFDSKSFDPLINKSFRRDLLESAIYSGKNYFKGIPTRHNLAVKDREFMLRLNGGYDENMTFSDLFLNSNFNFFRENVLPKLLSKFDNKYFIGNFRCKFEKEFKGLSLIDIPDNFFLDYDSVFVNTHLKLLEIPEFSLVFSSASSLSNTLGYRLKMDRPDITFIDVGTVVNDLVGLDASTRGYHVLNNKLGLINKISAFAYRIRNEYKIRW